MTTRTSAVHVVGTIRATDAQRAQGLLAYLQLDLDDQLVLDGVQLRRTRDGRHTLSWPERRDAAGRRHAVVRPAGDAARVALEDVVFAQLGLTREASP